jgi:hypothetical protein
MVFHRRGMRGKRACNGDRAGERPRGHKGTKSHVTLQKMWLLDAPARQLQPDPGSNGDVSPFAKG